MGKTTFAMSCSIHAALKERKSVLALSLEMSNGQLIDRAVASVGKIPLNMIRNGTACEYGTELGAASRTISMSSLYLADKPALNTIGRVRAMARRHKMRYGLDMLMVDYPATHGRGGGEPRQRHQLNQSRLQAPGKRTWRSCDSPKPAFPKV